MQTDHLRCYMLTHVTPGTLGRKNDEVWSAGGGGVGLRRVWAGGGVWSRSAAWRGDRWLAWRGWSMVEAGNVAGFCRHRKMPGVPREHPRKLIAPSRGRGAQP